MGGRGRNEAERALFKDDEGERDAWFRALYPETFTVLFRVARRICYSDEAAEDLVHDSYIKAVERWRIFPTLNDAKYWLIRVVKNGALNYVKRKGREQKVYQRYFRETEERSPSPEDDTLKNHDAEALKGALASLSDKFRSVLVLKEYAGLNYKEIGRVLGISEGNVKVRVFRAREALSALLREGTGDVS